MKQLFGSILVAVLMLVVVLCMPTRVYAAEEEVIILFNVSYYHRAGQVWGNPHLIDDMSFYLVDARGETIDLIDTRTREPVRRLGEGSGAYHAVFDINTSSIVIDNPGGLLLSIENRNNFAQKNTIQLSEVPVSQAISSMVNVMIFAKSPEYLAPAPTPTPDSMSSANQASNDTFEINIQAFYEWPTTTMNPRMQGISFVLYSPTDGDIVDMFLNQFGIAGTRRSVPNIRTLRLRIVNPDNLFVRMGFTDNFSRIDSIDLSTVEDPSRILLLLFFTSTPPAGYASNTPQPTPVPTPAPHNLNTASTWAHDSITQAITLGLVPQSLQNHYTNNITRAEFTAIAVLLYETITGREIQGRVTFNDTADINVQKAAYIGIVTGTGNNNFSPDMQFNREQAATIITRLAEAIGQPLSAAIPAFADNAQISTWASAQSGQVQAAGIMQGIGGNRFYPQGTFTREQSIITILRLFELLG